MAVKHQDNFGTNLTSNQSAGVTTTPINSIPTIAAPFYIALDATNINGSYEVVYVTSKTATNINHAATANAHTTAEEVRLVLPSTELNTLVSPQQGFIFNGKISPTVSSNNLTVALKTLNGTDPSTTDPVWIRIGDTVRAVTSALSVTKNAGTNWFNAGSTELATNEIDYFVYLGYNTTDGVVIGFSRIPYASQYDDFSVTTINEKYCAISTITNASSTDYYEVIGRFAATLGVTATYLWTVPTYTSKNLIQKPIYTTRLLNYTIVVGGYGTMTAALGTVRIQKYRINLDGVYVIIDADITIGGTPTYGVYVISPFLPNTTNISYTGTGYAQNSSGYTLNTDTVPNHTYFLFWRKYDGGNHGAGTFAYKGSILYQI